MSTSEYTVRGMTCAHCAGAVTSSVTGVAVDVASGRVSVDADRPVPADAFAAAVEEAGYEVVSP